MHAENNMSLFEDKDFEAAAIQANIMQQDAKDMPDF